jgi:uncharacterized damage-inducible protein DinB
MNLFDEKPNKETAPSYAHYYIDLISDESNMLEALEHDLDKMVRFLDEIPADKADFQYADDKWTLKNVVLHCIETERVFQFRALALSRKDSNNLPGFDEDTYAANNNSDNRTLSDLKEEFKIVRQSTIALFKGMDAEMLNWVGEANSQPATARNLGWIIVGHNKHHRRIIRERYLVDFEEN